MGFEPTTPIMGGDSVFALDWHEMTTTLQIPADVQGWLRRGDRGTSSHTMVSHLEGLPYEMFSQWPPRHPRDNSDFWRCCKLLDAVPRYRRRLDELRALDGPWPALVENWDRFETLLMKQLDGDEAAGKELYDAMDELGC